MIDNKTTAKVLKRMGVVLVTLPEPFTTPVGLACLVASQCLSNSIKKARLNMIQKKKHNRFPEDFVYPNEVNHNNIYTHEKVNYYSYDRSKRVPIPVQYKYNYIAKANPRPVGELPEKIERVEKYVVPNLERLERIKAEKLITARENNEVRPAYPDMKMIPHRVNLDALARRYQDMQSRNAIFNTTEETVPCAVNIKRLEQFKEMERLEASKPVETVVSEIKQRSVDVESLLKRYKKAPAANQRTPQIRTAPSFSQSYKLAMGYC